MRCGVVAACCHEPLRDVREAREPPLPCERRDAEDRRAEDAEHEQRIGEPVGEQRAAERVRAVEADEGQIETSYAAWRLGTPAPYSIVCVTRARVAKLPLRDWVAFIERHAGLKQVFEYEVMHLMSEVMAHTITLHLLDAPGRFRRFMRKHADLFERIPKKELASYLNLSAETLSRLKHRGKVTLAQRG